MNKKSEKEKIKEEIRKLIQKEKKAESKKTENKKSVGNKVDAMDVMKIVSATGDIIEIIKEPTPETEDDKSIKKENEEDAELLKLTIQVIKEEIDETEDLDSKMELKAQLKQKVTEYLKLKGLAEDLYNRETRQFNWKKFWKVVEVLGKDVVPILIKIFTK